MSAMGGGQTLYVRLAVGLGDLTAGLARGSAQLSAFGARTDAQMARLETWGKRNEKQLRSLGNVAGGIGLAAGAGIAVALKRYADFDAQMSKVQAATHATKEEMAALRAEAIKQGADTQFSAVEAGQGIEELAKAGVDTAAILGGGLKGALDLAAAGSLEVGTAAEIAATAMTQFQLSGDKVPHLADLLAAGAGKAQGEVTDLGAALQQSGLIASNMGLSIEDTTGTLAAFASAGLMGSDSGTSFKTMLQRLQSPIGQSQKAFDKWGISAYDAQGNFVGITNVADQLQSKLGGLDQATRDAALTQMFGADAIRAATVLYRQGGAGIQSWIDKTNDAGYAAETARLKTDNLAGDIERLGGSVDSFLINLGSGGNGPAREFVQMLESIVDVAGEIPAPIMGAAGAGLVLTAALGGTAFAATRLIGAVGATRANIAFLRAEVQRTTTAIVAMDRAQLGIRTGKAVAGLAGVGIAASSVADGFALTNTASYALMGTFLGPWGTAAGAAVGALMDIHASSQAASAGLEHLKAGLRDTSDLGTQAKALEAASATQRALASVGSGAFADQAAELEKAIDSTRRYQGAIQMLEDQTTGARDGVNELFDPARMQQFAAQAGPALQKIGLDLHDVLDEGPKGDNWAAAVAAIEEYRASTETAAGRSRALGDAVTGLDDDLQTTATSADGLAKALQGLVNPNLDFEMATIRWKDGLAQLKAELQDGTRTFDDNTDAGRRNVEALAGGVQNLQSRISAAAQQGQTGEQIAAMLEKGREALMAQGRAAGFSAGEMDKMLSKLGLTPEVAAAAADAVSGTAAAVDGLDDKTASPQVIAPDVAPAGAAIGEVGAKLSALDRRTARPRVDVTGLGGALNGLARLGNQIAALNGRTATVTTINRSVHAGQTRDAFGSFRPGLAGGSGIAPRYAWGGFSTGPMPAHIARAGIPRGIYAEPETHGESFIPHAMDRRRRATQILGMTAEKFGYDLSPRGMSAAGGGSTNVTHVDAPIIGGNLVVHANSRREAADAMDELQKRLRKLSRGGKLQ